MNLQTSADKSLTFISSRHRRGSYETSHRIDPSHSFDHRLTDRILDQDIDTFALYTKDLDLPSRNSELAAVSMIRLPETNRHTTLSLRSSVVCPHLPSDHLANIYLKFVGIIACYLGKY